jgi:hypothetical protein
MPRQNRLLIVLSVPLIAVLSASNTFADWTPKRCKATCGIFQSEFYGYYPTCWHKFPPGLPKCPPEEQVEETLPAPKAAPAAATLPTPKPEAKQEPKTLPVAPPNK